MERKICDIIRDVLPLYIDDIVCADTKEWVEAHLAECPECAKAAEDMRVQPTLPANVDVRHEDTVQLKRFRRFLSNRTLKTTLVSLLAALLLISGCYIWLIKTVDIIEYDGSNIIIEESDQGFSLMLKYNGTGYVSYGAGTDLATGVTSLVVTQSLWEKYIEPIYDADEGRYYLMESYRTKMIVDQETGEVLWEADEEQTARYEEWVIRFRDEMDGAEGGG